MVTLQKTESRKKAGRVRSLKQLRLWWYCLQHGQLSCVCSGWREVFYARSWEERASEQNRREWWGGGWVDEEVQSRRTTGLLIHELWWFRLSTVGSRAFNVSGPRIWNGLPEEVVSAPTLSSFRRRLKSFPFSAVISWCCHLTVKLYIWHYSGPCSDVCHLGHSKYLWTELNWTGRHEHRLALALLPHFIMWISADGAGGFKDYCLCTSRHFICDLLWHD